MLLHYLLRGSFLALGFKKSPPREDAGDSVFHYELELCAHKPAFTIRPITPADDSAMAAAFAVVVDEFGADGTPVGGPVVVLDDEVSFLYPSPNTIEYRTEYTTAAVPEQTLPWRR